jgi:hypothetical protein|tara:strand:+ start:2723 stop:3178 length:456 start_codon:yes stop_codon:yes gene_type:complete
MKKFFKYLGFGFLSVVVFFLAVIAITSIGSIDKEETFPPYIYESVPKLTTWDIEQYKLLMSEEGIGAATPEQWELYLEMFKKLGQLQSVGVPELQNSRVASTVASGNTTYAVYLVPLTFDTGKAHIQLGLQHNDGKVEINSVRFLSDLLLK